MSWAQSEGIPTISLSDLQVEEDSFAKGGYGEVFRGDLFANGKPPPIKVAIKRSRVQPYGEATRVLVRKTKQQLDRELGIWTCLQNRTMPHPHILPLLGIIEVSSGLVESVSEYCVDNLAVYLEKDENRPRRIELLLGTLRGLVHMHKLSIVHGDLKSENVLVTERGVAKICDFGHSRYVGDRQDQISVSDTSTVFQATMRYMCPEFFRSNRARPTLFSDMWAFGCLALEILSQLQPYHTIESEFSVPVAIRSGVAPSVKPVYPNAAGCLSDALWNAVKSCWYWNPSQRPSSDALLESIDGFVERGLVNPMASTPERPLLPLDGDIFELPAGTKDYADELKNLSKESLYSSITTNVWAYYDKDEDSATNRVRTPRYVVKTAHNAGGTSSSRKANQAFENELRQVMQERNAFRHQNLVTILGVDSSFGQHFGIVIEYCRQGNFLSYKNKMPQEEGLNLSYITQILNGLQYMHSMTSPVPHGDLTPKNILVDEEGNLKLTPFSLARLSLNMRSKDRKIYFGDYTPSARYMSPELLQPAARPTPASDMWAFGNVAFWMFSSVVPYPEQSDEIEVIAQITAGVPPNRPSQSKEQDEFDELSVIENSLWLSNGIWESILECWNVTVEERLTASQFLRQLENVSHMPERAWSSGSWTIEGVKDLTGQVKKSETRNYGASLSSFRGIWRGAYDGRGTRTKYIELWYWKTSLSQGFFRSNLDIMVKGVQLIANHGLKYAARQAIRHELMILKQIKHKNICSLLGFDQQYMHFNGVPGIVLEYCPNGTLQEYYSRNFDKIHEQEKAKLAQDLTSAIHYLHHQISQGLIVHGNLSMDTILLTSSHTLKLSDFSLACQYAHSDNMLEAPVLFAPPLAPMPSRWHAPEFFDRPPGGNWFSPTVFTDLWALGCVIGAIWTNKTPYENYDSPGSLTQITSGVMPYSRSDCPVQVWGVVSQLWAVPFYDRVLTERVLWLMSRSGDL